jgi:hypothetical protein
MMRIDRRRWAINHRKVIGPTDNPLILRRQLLQTPLFGIYVHVMRREDADRYPHDHPWNFWSLILRGGYEEMRYPDAARRRCLRMFVLSHTRWRLHRLRVGDAHRVISVQPGTVTLVIVGRHRQVWGFYPDGQWIEWRWIEWRKRICQTQDS